MTRRQPYRITLPAQEAKNFISYFTKKSKHLDISVDYENPLERKTSMRRSTSLGWEVSSGECSLILAIGGGAIAAAASIFKEWLRMQRVKIKIHRSADGEVIELEGIPAEPTLKRIQEFLICERQFEDRGLCQKD